MIYMQRRSYKLSNVQAFSRYQMSFQLVLLDEMIDKENPV